jgi:hypothetical protein
MIPELAGSEMTRPPSVECALSVRSYGGDVKYVRFGLGASALTNAHRGVGHNRADRLWSDPAGMASVLLGA